MPTSRFKACAVAVLECGAKPLRSRLSPWPRPSTLLEAVEMERVIALTQGGLRPVGVAAGATNPPIDEGGITAPIGALLGGIVSGAVDAGVRPGEVVGELEPASRLGHQD